MKVQEDVRSHVNIVIAECLGKFRQLPRFVFKEYGYLFYGHVHFPFLPS